MRAFSFSHTDIDPQALRAALEDPAAGGYASFEGWVRNHNEGRTVTRLEYEAFEALAIKEGARIVQEALERFGVIRAACVHRLGSLTIGDMAVWVGVSAHHRAEAFAACRYIIDEVKHRVPIWKKEHYVDGDSGWVNCERCAQHAHEHAHHHSRAREDHHERADSAVVRAASSFETPLQAAQIALPDYSRQMTLREVGEAGQAKLRAARVLVIGAGGLGVPVLSYLAGAGVGTIGIVDSDTLDASNLHRQTLYSIADVGKPKAILAVERLRALNPEVSVQAHLERFTAANAAQRLADYDLLIECSDNFSTKFLANDAAVAAHKPAVLASVYQYEGQLQVYRPEPDSACLRCLWPEATRDGLIGNCAEAGVLGPVPGVLGCLEALEALKLLLGLPALTNELLLIDLLTLQQRKLRTARRADCDHSPAAFAARMAAVAARERDADLEVSAAEWRRAGPRAFTVIDVRELQEVREHPLEQAGSRHIPLARLLDNHAALDPQERYLLVCARGARSLAAAQHLREHGFAHAYSLKGGVAALNEAPAT